MQSTRKLRQTYLTGLIILVSSCSAGYSRTAAEINGTKISRDELEQTITELDETGQAQVQDGQVEGDVARNILTALVQGQATLQLLGNYDIQITDADRDVIKESLAQQSDTNTFPKHLKNLIIELNAGTIALKRVEAPTAQKAASMYDEAPASLGVMCVRHIVVEKRDEAQRVLDRITDGGDFAVLAGEFSIEPNAKQTGGALSGADNACLVLSEYQSSFDADFTAGALQAKPGVAYGPVKSSFGYHVIYIRPFVEVAQDISALMTTDPGEKLLTGFLSTSKIRVDSAYGRWNSARGSIVAN